MSINIDSVEKYISDANENEFSWTSYKAQEIGRIPLPARSGTCCVKIGVGGINWPLMGDEKLALLVQSADGAISEFRSWMPFKQGSEQIFQDVPCSGGFLVVLYTDEQELTHQITDTLKETELKAENESLKDAIVSNKTSENISTAIKAVAVIAVVGGVLALAAYASPYLKTFAAVKK